MKLLGDNVARTCIKFWSDQEPYYVVTEQSRVHDRLLAEY